MAYLVSHPDEVKLVSYRFGKGATAIDKYLELDGYTSARKAIALGPEGIIAEMKASEPARPRRRRLPYRHEVVLCSQAIRQTKIRPGQRRRERAGHLQRPADLRVRPPLGDRGRDHRRLGHRLQDGLHLPARRISLPAQDHGEGYRRRLRQGLSGQEHLWQRCGFRHRLPHRRGRLRSGRRVGLDGIARRQARHSPHPASLSRGGRPLWRPHHHQQRGDPGHRAPHLPHRRRGVRQDRLRAQRRHPPLLSQRRCGQARRLRAAHGLQPQEDDLRGRGRHPRWPLTESRRSRRILHARCFCPTRSISAWTSTR